jgi:hypothetical protein
MIIRKKRLAVIIGMTGLLVSCGHLSRSNATHQIEEKQKDVEEHAFLWVGTVSHNCDDKKDEDLIPGAHSSYPDPVQSDKVYAVLSATGYITIRPIKEHVWNVELTNRGKEVAGRGIFPTKTIDCDAWEVPITLEKFDSANVSGIVEDGADAKVEVDLRYVLTPVALAIMKQDPTFSTSLGSLGHKTFNFVKYDDGWRIK